MESKPLILTLMILLSLMAGCVEDIREDQSVEKNDDLRNIDGSITNTNNETSTQIISEDEVIKTNDTPEDLRNPVAENITREECEREGGIWIEATEERSGNGSLHDMAMSTIRKIGGITDNNSIDDYDNDDSGGLDWDEFVEIWNSVEDENLTNDSQNYREIFASFHEIDFDSDGELSIVELLRSQEEIITNERPSWCSFTNGDGFEITQELCEERGGTWTEAPERGGESYCEYEGREEPESNITQEDCERRGGTWTEAPDRGGESYCEYEEREESESNITQEDCERRGGTWTEAPDREGKFYCDFDEEEEREEDEETSENNPQEDCEERGGTWIEDRRECQE